MPEDVIINFVGDTSQLQPVENAMDTIVAQAGEVGQAWAKTSGTIAAENKKTADSTTKIGKSITELANAAKSMDKAVVGNAYKKYLTEIQTALGLTNKELVAYIQTAKVAAQQAIFQADTQEQADALTLSIQSMNEQLVLLEKNEDDTGTKTQSLRARIREAKEELVSMAEAGLQGTPAFQALQQHAGELDDQMRDLNASIKNVGSDTKHIDGIISLAGGVAGGFAVAQGAAALFGSENEEVQKALLKVNAAMSILQGLQQVQNVLQKESAASILFSTTVRTGQTAAVTAETAAEVANVAATEAATVATTELNAAMSLNPVGLLIVGILAAVAAFSAFNDEIESSEDRMDRLTKKADVVYDALQRLSKINQSAIDRDIDIVKNKELVQVLSAQGKSVEEINKQKKIGLSLEADQLKDQMLNIESAKDIAADKTQFIERELELKTKIYENSQAQLVLDIETNKVQSERALKSASALADAEVAKRKLAILQNQVDSIASIKAVSDAEINAIRRKQQEELRPGNGLTPGEIIKINADADLAIAENRKALQASLLKIDNDGIQAKVLLAKKGSEDEYNNRLSLLENEKKIELDNAIVAGKNKLQIEADFTVKKRELDRAYEEQKMQDEISFFNANIDEFGLGEERKLELTLRRLDMQRDLEISQAEGNAAKIKEINAKYDKQRIEANKATIAAILADNLKTQDAFSAVSKAASEKVLSQEKSTFDERKSASENLLRQELLRLDLEASAENNKLKQGLVTQHEYDIAIQDINNKRTAATIKSEEEITAATLKEVEKRTASIQAAFSVFQKGLTATLGNSGLTVALTEIQNFGTAAQDVFAKIKAGTITAAEGLKELAAAAIGATQQIVNQIFADGNAQRQQQLDETISHLEEVKAKELDNANLTEKQKFEINQRFAEKEKQVKIAAFKADKEAKKEQAVINGLLAVTQAFATNPFPYSLIVAAIVAASTAIQVAKINSTPVPKFRHGKVNIEGPGTTTSDSIPAMISRGESVINADATNKWKGALEAINENKFESWLTNKLSDFIFPHVPDDIQPAGVTGSIDYKLLAKEVAEQLRGIIPSSRSIEVINDSNGQRVFVIETNSKTEYKNKRYSMK